MKKVLLVELDYHAEVLKGCYLHLAPHFDTYIYTNREIYDKAQLEVPADRVFFRESPELTQLAEQVDLVLFTTAQRNFRQKLRLRGPFKTAVIVHNVNAYFFPHKLGYPKSIYWLWKDLSYLVRIVILQRELFFKSKFLRSVDHFLMPSQFMIDTSTQSSRTI